VTSAKTVILDDEGKAQLKELQAILTTKVEALKTDWNNKLDSALASGDVLVALQLAARPPEFRMQVPADKASAIATLASNALRADVASGTWIEILRAVGEVPMHRLVKPAGIPEDEAARAEAVKFAGKVPALATMLGMKVPPPPPAVRRAPRPSTPRP
jgi:hypothetical protein